MEIELKLATVSGAKDTFIEQVLPRLDVQSSDIGQMLKNTYYDTEDGLLNERKMGFRIRCVGEHIEQTIKVKGQVIGGLHQRPEYNVVLRAPIPELTLFPSDIWASDLQPHELNSRLIKWFTTDFRRDSYLIQMPTGLVELAFDDGVVQGKSGDKSDTRELCEIELELIEGKVNAIYDLAAILNEHLGVRLANQSKAQRGYLLATGKRPKIRPFADTLKLSAKTVAEDAFVKAIESCLKHWDHHAFAYIETQKLRALTEIAESLRYALQAVSLFLPILPCDELAELQKDLLSLLSKWRWQSDLIHVRKLKAKTGIFCKKIPDDDTLMSYLMGRREGVLNHANPVKLLHSSTMNRVTLSCSRLIQLKPWRQQHNGNHTSLRSLARGWMGQSWNTMVQALDQKNEMTAHDYRLLGPLLSQSLVNGYLLGALFGKGREDFRASWVDIKAGIDDLNTLEFLQRILAEVGMSQDPEWRAWVDMKTQATVRALELCRQQALLVEPYW